MVFAVIRVVTALFIKETLASAANDAEMVIEESRRMAVEYQERLEAGDGNIWLIYIYIYMIWRWIKLYYDGWYMISSGVMPNSNDHDNNGEYMVSIWLI